MVSYSSHSFPYTLSNILYCISTATNSALDLVCKLNSDRLEDNKLFRLCVIVLTASYFKKWVAYPLRSYNVCFEEEIAFETDEGEQKAFGNTYKELTVECWAKMINDDPRKYSISRAYNPNEVFVHNKDKSSNKLYLEALVKNVSIVHESYNFDKPEEK